MIDNVFPQIDGSESGSENCTWGPQRAYANDNFGVATDAGRACVAFLRGMEETTTADEGDSAGAELYLPMKHGEASKAATMINQTRILKLVQETWQKSNKVMITWPLDMAKLWICSMKKLSHKWSSRFDMHSSVKKIKDKKLKYS
jgi:hypothetical protein